MNIVLLEPEIPHNTGAIGRTCAATNAVLHLIRPLGFSTDEKAVRRSGLDYWHELDVRYYDNFEEFIVKIGSEAQIFLSTTKAPRDYTEVSYPIGSYIIFGKESAGIPMEILTRYRERCVRVPMLDQSRSLNLSVAAGIVLYEALRQQGFPGLCTQRESVIPLGN